MSETRQRLVTATNELFRRRGFNGTSLKAITEAASAPIGSLYHFFPGGKTELAQAVISETGAAYGELFEMIFDGAPDPASAVADFFSGAANTLEETDFIDICPIATISSEMASTDDAVRSSAAAVFELWSELAANRFRRSGLNESAARELSTTIVAMLEGSFVLARAHHDASAVRTASRHARQIVDHAFAVAAVDAELQ